MIEASAINRKADPCRKCKDGEAIRDYTRSTCKQQKHLKQPQKKSFNRRQAGNKQGECFRCGLNHGPSCPAKNVKCNKCNKPGHYARCCKTKQLTEVSCRYKNESESSEEEFFIGTITNHKDDPRRWFVQLPVNGHSVKFKIDSGADVSVMSLSTYENMLEVPVLRPTTHRLKGVNGVLKCKEHSYPTPSTRGNYTSLTFILLILKTIY